MQSRGWIKRGLADGVFVFPASQGAYRLPLRELEDCDRVVVLARLQGCRWK